MLGDKTCADSFACVCVQKDQKLGVTIHTFGQDLSYNQDNSILSKLELRPRIDGEGVEDGQADEDLRSTPYHLSATTGRRRTFLVRRPSY